MVNFILLSFLSVHFLHSLNEFGGFQLSSALCVIRGICSSSASRQQDWTIGLLVDICLNFWIEQTDLKKSMFGWPVLCINTGGCGGWRTVYVPATCRGMFHCLIIIYIRYFNLQCAIYNLLIMFSANSFLRYCNRGKQAEWGNWYFRGHKGQRHGCAVNSVMRRKTVSVGVVGSHQCKADPP